jgi:hypothetical protein
MNNQKGIAPIIIILTVIILFLGGLLIFQYMRMSKKEVKITEEKPILKEQPILKEKPVSIQQNEEEKLKDFVFEQLVIQDSVFKLSVEPKIIMSREEFEREFGEGKAYSLFEIFRKDLDNDGVDEIIIGAEVPVVPSLSWIVVIRENNGNYLLLDWKKLSEGDYGGIREMKIKNIPNDKYPAIVVEWYTGGGIAVFFYETTSIFHFINKQLKLTFEENRSVFEQKMVGTETEIKKNEYHLIFRDYDGDGNIDIFQEGIETERKNDEIIKVSDVSRLYKWDESQKVFKLAEDLKFY